MNIENIINKFNYEPELADILRKIYPEFITYFGSEYEPIIYEALMSTKIITCDNIYTALVENGLLEPNTEGIVTEQDLRRAAGVYHSSPIINYNADTNTFSIEGAKRLVAINSKDFSSEYSKTTLIHELGHLIKSYYNEYKIEGDTLITKSGLIISRKKLKYQDGIVTKEFISEEGVGLEEGFNSVLEEEIARRIINPEYKVSGYGVVNIMTNMLFKKYDIKAMVLTAQLLGEKDKLIANLDEELALNAYSSLDELADKLYRLTLKAFSEIFQTDVMKKTYDEIVKIIQEEYHPLLDKIDKNRQNKLGG